MTKHSPYQLTYDTWICSKCGKKMLDNDIQTDCPVEHEPSTRLCWVHDLETIRKHIQGLETFADMHSSLYLSSEVREAKERVFAVFP